MLFIQRLWKQQDIMKEEEDNEYSRHLFSSSESDNKSVPPLPSTHDFAAALESNAGNQEIGTRTVS
jgi:hypothetical protein